MASETKSGFTFKLFFSALISLLFCHVGPSLAIILDGPRDTAALDGTTNVALNCTVSTGDSILWVASVPWSIIDLNIYPPKQGAPPNANFTWSPNGTTLYIKSLNQHLATIYTCKSNIDDYNFSSARVASVEPVKCPGTIMADEGEQVNTSCSVTYYSNSVRASSPLKATLAAYDENGLLMTKVTATDPGRLDLNVTVTATAKMDNKRITCKVFFDQALNQNLKATIGTGPALDFENECNFVVQIEHLTTTASIETAFNDTSNQVNVGDIINCTANGRPAPRYEWFDEKNNSLSATFALEFKDSMASDIPERYTCVAENILMEKTGYAEASIIVTVLKVRREEVKEGMAGWLIAVIVLSVLFVILIVVGLILFLCRRNKATSKPYKAPPKSSKYEPGTTNSLIYTPSRAAPTPSTNAAAVPSPAVVTASAVPFARPPLRQSSSPASPPPNNFANNSFPVSDHLDDFMPPRSANLIGNSGHGDLGMAGLNGSRGSNLNMGSRGNLQDPGMGRRPENQNFNGNSFSPRNTDPHGSAEAVNFFPMPPPLTVRGQNQQSGPTQYYDNMGPNGPKNKKQGQPRNPPPPPLAYPGQQGLGRQSSLTSNSTNPSVSTDGGRTTGGKGVEKKNKPTKAGGGPKRVASPPGMDETPPRRPPPKKAGVQPMPMPYQIQGGYPSDRGSLHGSEV